MTVKTASGGIVSLKLVKSQPSLEAAVHNADPGTGSIEPAGFGTSALTSSLYLFANLW